MKSRTFACALTVASLAFSSLSFAQAAGSYYDSDSQRLERQRVEESRGLQNRLGDDPRGDRRGDFRRDYRRDDRRADHYYYGARGPDWRRGGYVPYQYRSRQYVVNDWRGHHLSAPPRGHQWVQVGGDYVLMAVATGLIVNLLLAQ